MWARPSSPGPFGTRLRGSSMKNVVVGGGLVGCAVALELARRGEDVLCLERAVPGAEASSAAGGILSPRVEAHGDLAARTLGIASLDMYEAWVDSLAADVGFRRCGVLVLKSESPDEDAAPVAGSAIAAIAPGLVARSAWWLPDEGMLDTRRLVGAVRDAASRAGVEFRSGRTVVTVDADGVGLEDGERFQGRVAVCAGAWTASVGGLDGLPVRPVRGQLVALADTSVTNAVVFGPNGYLVPREDELVVGATMEEVGFARGVTAGGVRQVLDHAFQLAPGLAGTELLRAWSSFRPGSPDGNPLVGRVRGAWLASGHFRNGILLAPLTARRLVAAMLDGDPLPSTWSPERFGG